MNINNVTNSRLRDYIKRLTRRKDWLDERIKGSEDFTFDKAERNALIYAIYLMQRDLAERIKNDLKEEK